MDKPLKIKINTWTIQIPTFNEVTLNFLKQKFESIDTIATTTGVTYNQKFEFGIKLTYEQRFISELHGAGRGIFHIPTVLSTLSKNGYNVQSVCQDILNSASSNTIKRNIIVNEDLEVEIDDSCWNFLKDISQTLIYQDWLDDMSEILRL